MQQKSKDIKLPSITSNKSKQNEEQISEYSLQLLSNDIYENSTADVYNNVGPGSYNVPSTINNKSTGIYKNVPKYSLGRSPKGQSLDVSCGPGKYYSPDYKVTKEGIPGIKMSDSVVLKKASKETPSPGPKYDYQINKMGQNIGARIAPEGLNLDHPKFVTPSTHDYHIVSVFDDNKKKRKGITIGVSGKCISQKRDSNPGPGSYDFSSIDKKNKYSFPKVML